MRNPLTSVIAYFKNQSSEADKIVTATETKATNRVTALNDVASKVKTGNDLVAALAKLAKDEKKADEQKEEENKLRQVFGIPTVY